MKHSIHPQRSIISPSNVSSRFWKQNAGAFITRHVFFFFRLKAKNELVVIGHLGLTLINCGR